MTYDNVEKHLPFRKLEKQAWYLLYYSALAKDSEKKIVENFGVSVEESVIKWYGDSVAYGRKLCTF